jgi:hypothetical protein
MLEEDEYENVDLKKCENLRDKLISDYNDGYLAFMDNDFNFSKVLLKDFIKYPVDSILYDLNRIEPVILTFLKNPKWVNDFAMCKLVRALKDRIDELEKQIETK